MTKYYIKNRRKTVHTSLDETRLLICTTTPTDIEPWKKVYAILLRPDPLSQVAGSSLATTEVEKPRMIGVLGSPREAELAYKLHPDFWGKGYMSEALKAFIEIYWAGKFIFKSSNSLQRAKYYLQRTKQKTISEHSQTRKISAAFVFCKRQASKISLR